MTDTVAEGTGSSAMDETGLIAIAGELTIYQVAEVKPVLQAALDRAKLDKTPPRIDLTGMTECDGAGLQMLLSLARAAKIAETHLELLNVPNEINAMLVANNVAGFFTLSPGG
jgi:ABC-type transporter Mla MlaB component